VLRRDRGEHRRPVYPQRRERLQVGLDAGAAAGIRARYGYGDRGHRSASALSTTARSACAAACGSRCIDNAEITATPSAPAAMTGAALVTSMPAIAHTGKS